MKQPTFCGRELLPLSVIEAARAGDPLAVERILQVISGAIGGMARRTRSNDAQRVKRTGLENINELRYQLRRTLEVLSHTHMGKLNVIEHLHRLTS